MSNYDETYKGYPRPIIGQITATGKSAYQSWLDQGNVGSEADFINSLLLGESFIYKQTTTSDVWIINHNLNKFPSVTTVTTIDGEERVIKGEVVYLDENNLEIRFRQKNNPFALKGKAYLN